MVLLNRATTWLRVRVPENCISDCRDIQSLLDKLDEEERKDEFYTKI